MTRAIDILEAEINGHPDRDDGWGLYRHVLELAHRIKESDRKGLVDALDAWLKQRSSPRTGIAVDIAGELKLVELRNELERFRQEVLAGKCGPLWCTRDIDKAIHAML